mmetsp:Transcript_27050/g.71780  ORF Transcript_27050/g.71780 Transcript_27050/m.71780 type:complete len:220 (+) Transcript_27050:486-1145(+)
MKKMQGHPLLRLIQGGAPEHMANQANDTSKLVGVGERSIESDAAALRGPANDHPLGVSTNPLHLATDKCVHPRTHVQQALVVQRILSSAALVCKIVEPRIELDATPAKCFALPHHPVREASLLLFWRGRQHYTDRGTRNAKVVGEVRIIEASLAEAMQIDQCISRRRLASTCAARVKGHTGFELNLLPIFDRNRQCPPLLGDAQPLESLRARDLKYSLR